MLPKSYLLELYSLGWMDESNSHPIRSGLFIDEEAAYVMGRLAFIIGDDVPSLDYRSDDEIYADICRRLRSIKEDRKRSLDLRNLDVEDEDLSL